MKIVGLGLVLAMLIGCSAETVNVVPRSFDRPERIAFVCFNTATDVAVAMEMCRTPAEGELADEFSLHALVTQTARGEVAAVDLRRDDLIDSDLRVPGFTFVAVGEVPSALVVDPADPAFTFVANYGSEDILAVPTALFLSPGAETADVPRIALTEGPRDLILAPSGNLVAVLSRSGELVSIERVGAGFGTATPVVLDAAMPPIPATEVPGTDFEKICAIGAEPLQACGDEGGTPVGCAVPRTFDVPVGTTARPVRAIVDDIGRKILVADEALPWIHVLDGDTLVEEPGIWVGVPTRDLVLTPLVDARVNSMGEFEDRTARYLYAIDATDGSVLVVDYTTGSPSFGAVLAVDVQGVRSQDRIGIDGVARSLEIMTPGFPEGEPCARASERSEDASPGNLHGVFLAVAMSDGSVRIVDIQDLDMFCRGGDALMCESPINPDDNFVFIRRHRPRLADLIREPPAVQGAPSVISGGTSIRIDATGLTEPESVPDLAIIECPASFIGAFPAVEDGQPLICVTADPWSGTSEQWTFTWEGAIPGTAGGNGRFTDGDATLFRGEAQFCGRGVLGSRDVPTTSVPEANLVGDQLVITADLPPRCSGGTCVPFEDLPEAERELCGSLIVDDGRGGRLPIAFEIFEARSADPSDMRPSLRIGDRLIGALAATRMAAGQPIDIAFVQSCFTELFTYEVRSRESYVVTGTRTGFLHRVIAGADGTCEVDETRDVRLMGRAFGPTSADGPVTPFANFLVSLMIVSDPPAGTDAAIVFTTGDVPPKLGVDIGALPTDVRYSDEQGVLYTVDTATLGLVRIELDPFRRTETFE